MPHRRPEMLQVQAPALMQLAALGWEILTEKEASRLRESRGEALLMGVLSEKLRQFNPRASEGDIAEFLRRFTPAETGNLIEDNKTIFEHLTKGITIESASEGQARAKTLVCIDWDNIDSNRFQAAAEFAYNGARFDIVLFVNGIPLAVLECKNGELVQAMNELEYYSRSHGGFFLYVQFTAALTASTARYGTVGTKAEFYSVWKEGSEEAAFTPNLPPDVMDRIFSGRLEGLRDEAAPSFSGDRVVLIKGLFAKDRLLQLVKHYILNDGGLKKVPRYQQYFVVEETLKRIQNKEDGARQGGVIWHTQGSGKSLTMVLLAKNILERLALPDARIILLTDRINLDSQLTQTFKSCNIGEIHQASGADNLAALLKKGVPIIATLIHKFADINKDSCSYSSPDIFVFADEAHRSQYGELSGKVRAILPNACFIGFTGTPIFQREKANTFRSFGGIIEPSYTIRTAIEDKAIVPLLYEARYLDKNIVDQEGLKEALKTEVNPNDAPPLGKYKLLGDIKRIPQIIEKIAADISAHYQENFQGKNGKAWAKAQLAVDTREEALMYHRAFQKLGKVNTALVISKGMKDDGALARFFKESSLSERAYTQRAVRTFEKDTREIELIIVADKLLTGFDAPINTVLYLNKLIKGHTLLQAIARVNRVYQNKDYGRVVDYLGLLGKLTDALDKYDALAGFDPEDLQGALIPIQDEIQKLPSLLKTLNEYFPQNGPQYILENSLRIFTDEPKRALFYRQIDDYARCLWLCLSSTEFQKSTPQKEIDIYKEYLAVYKKTKQELMLQYSDSASSVDSDENIGKLLSQYIKGGEILQINKPIDIMDKVKIKELQEKKESSPDSVATTLLYAMKRHAETHMKENPAFYEFFLDRLKGLIKEHKEQMISDVDSLFDMQKELEAEHFPNIPESLTIGNERAYYANSLGIFQKHNAEYPKKAAEALSLALNKELSKLTTLVHPWGRKTQINKIANDFAFYICEDLSLNMPFESAEELAYRLLEIAEERHVKSEGALLSSLK